MKKRYSVKNKYVKLVIPVILFVVVFLTICYSAFSNNLGIYGISELLEFIRMLELEEYF